VTPAELRTKYERLLADTVPGALLPAHEVYRAFLRELAHLNGGSSAPLSYDTGQAAAALAVSPKTIAHWCHAGRFPGARRTGGRGGKWVIPAAAVTAYAEAGRRDGPTGGIC